MKLLVTIIVLLSGIFIQAQKKALIIAISSYEDLAWPYINSNNDVPLIKNALLTKGFSEADILILQDDQATKENIVDKFREHLINKALPGGTYVFHFSGHGQQVVDTNGDESDGYDESMVAYDGGPYYDPITNTGQNHFTDDEFGELLIELRKKAGKKGNVLVNVDACFSGTISRGNKVCRSTNLNLAPDDYMPEVKFSTAPNETGGLFAENNDNNLAALVVFSGARQNEPNYETYDSNKNPVGSLSYAFSRALTQSNKNTSYIGLFDLIKADMASFAPLQTPLAEGDLNAIVFGGKSTDPVKHFTIKSFNKDSTCTIEAGGLAGIFIGAEISLYPIDTRDISVAKLIAKGTVIDATEFYSKIKLTEIANKSAVKTSWAFITKESFGDMKVNLCLKTSKKYAFKKNFKDFQLVNLVKDTTIADIILKETIDNNKVIFDFIVKNDLNYKTSYNENEDFELILEETKSQILNYSKTKFIKQINSKSERFNVKMELVPVDYVVNDGQAEVSKAYQPNSKVKSGQVIYNEGDVFYFRIINLSYAPAYYQVIDIQPDNKISVIIPDAYSNATDYRIEPMDTIELKSSLMQISPPYGKDILKIVASEKPIDNLRDIVNNEGNFKKSRGAALSPFEILISNTISGTKSRGSKNETIGKNEININSLIINIKK